MRGFGKLLWAHFLLLVRNPIAAFFALFYAPFLLLIFGSIYGNAPSPHLGGLGVMDVSVPGYIGLVILAVGFISLPVGTAAQRESGVLRRFRATPLHPLAYLLSETLAHLFFALSGIFLLVLTGRLLYHVRFEGQLVGVLLAILLSLLAFFALGYLVAALAPNARAAQAITLFLAFPMMFFSGASIPLQALPVGIQNLARFIPLTHAVRLIQGLWFGHPWRQYGAETLILLAVLFLSTALAAWAFRWE